MTRSPKDPPKDHDEEHGLWRRVKDTVSPLKARKPDGPATKRTAPHRSSKSETRPIEPRTARPKNAPVKQRRATSEDRSAHKKVRRGRIEAQAQIDLHGKTHDEARAYLLRRLEGHAGENIRTVLVITGRGMRDEGVLRTGLPIWMGEGCFRVLVSGYAPAHTRHGGKGAWYVFLRKTVPL